ncbi:MmcQ/YjbR family DNA-binding protein [Nocardioides panacisoli]|uniref:MmcQ/YjbR family DNA-binding protein n=1 Tax=Nocardioides panacisoli TaxID=627624 RepID=UPI001C6337B3|nr:MmcQ/YjbR family DNA-binding protein [Nocardioides panacisoli]QYJ04491.1 MmcQ/YjbR family DNA-binding protein [Nocardioides panacisoli]
MPHEVMFSEDDPGLAELREICLAYPAAEERVSHGRPTFRAAKVFAAFGASEKLRPGEHRQVPSALVFLPDAVDLPAIEQDERFLVPAYWGPYGARALDLAAPGVDWTEVAELVDASYRRVATPRLLARLDAAAEG